MIWALRDVLDKFHFARHNSPDIVIEKYLRDILRILNVHYLTRVCRDIETELRLSIHLDLKSDESHLFKEGLKDLSKFINIQPIVIYDKYIDIKSKLKLARNSHFECRILTSFCCCCCCFKAHVKKYLDRTFYDLTTVALHDWKAYSEMRNLAQHKYHLNLTDPYLPSSTLEQVCT